MSESALQFESTDRLGKVAAVDTTRVLIGVADPQLVTRVGIGNLIAVKGSTEQEYLIGITEKVTRSLRDDMIDPDDDGEEIMELGPRPDDVVRIVLLGTFRTVQGERKNTFKRGADSFPQIDRDCYFIEGANLQRFMGLLGAELNLSLIHI